ncbi:xylulokinase [soil metagenome]
MWLIGLDLGTQSVKAVVCDASLAIRGAHSVGYETSHPQPGWAEQDPRAWEAALLPAIQGALAAANVSPDDVSALAIAAQLDGCIAVDANDTPLHPALIWQDRRAIAEAALADKTRLFALAGQVADASHFAAKLVWLRSHLRCGVPTRYHQPTSYLVARLTGESAMDASLASTTMLAALDGAWSPELCAMFDIDPGVLPAIRGTSDVAGTLSSEGARLTGLPVGVRVAVGTGDDFANALGAGVVEPGTILCAVGTAEVVGAVFDRPLADFMSGEPMVETHVYPVPGMFFIENPGWLSGGAVRWATQMLGLADDRALDALAAKAPPGCDGVTFIPALNGSMTPVWRPEMRGALHGLTATHGPEHMARAVLEGLAFACRDVVERLAVMGLSEDHVVLAGGGAQSSVWTQIRADVLGLPHRVSAITDASPLGAAMIAAVAAGSAPDLVAAAALVPRPREEVLPNPAVTDVMGEAYRRYQRLIGLALSALV